MDKYIKRKDALEVWNKRAIAYVNAIFDLPTITVPKIINGVILKDCDKVIAPFLEEHECDELWEAVRALRDFYDWVAEEERIEK